MHNINSLNSILNHNIEAMLASPSTSKAEKSALSTSSSSSSSYQHNNNRSVIINNTHLTPTATNNFHGDDELICGQLTLDNLLSSLAIEHENLAEIDQFYQHQTNQHHHHLQNSHVRRLASESDSTISSISPSLSERSNGISWCDQQVLHKPSFILLAI